MSTSTMAAASASHLSLVPEPDADTRPSPRNVVLATRVDDVDAEFIHGACMERGITVAAFLREAAIQWAQH